jgi:hypothetical protein
MNSGELASKLNELKPGESLLVPVYTLIALFGSTGAILDEDAVKHVTAFADKYGCRFVYEEVADQQPGFLKSV